MRANSRVIINSSNEIGLFNDLLISKYIKHSKGRSALAQAMVAPIRRNLDYNSIARKLFVVEPLPQGAPLAFPKIKHNHVIIDSRNKVGTREQLAKFSAASRVKIPMFTISSSPSIHIGDIKSRRFNIIDRAVTKARSEIMNQEDASIFEALDDLCKEKPKKSSIFDKMKFWYKKLLQYLDI